MRVLVTGAESSGTKLVAALLSSRGVETVHRSMPAGVEWLLPDGPWDAICVCHRHGPLTARSQTYSGHSDTETEAFAKITRGYGLVYAYAQVCGCLVVPVTYEALVYEQDDAIGVLLDALGLERSASHVRIGNANAKYYGREAFSDESTVEEMVSL